MGVDDELSTPILHNDEDDHRNRRTYNDDELDASNGIGGCCCNPSSGCHRFIALILMCLVGFGRYFEIFSSCLVHIKLIKTFINNFQPHTFAMTILERCKITL